MVSDVYFPRINGVSTSIQTFRRELRALGHTVHLIAPDYHAPSDDESDILRVPARTVPRDPEDRFMRFNWVMEHLGKLRSEFYDIIHIQTPFVAHYLGLKLGRNMRIPCMETYHTFFEEYLYHYVPFLPKSLMKMAARNFSRHQGNSLNGMVIPSQPMLDALREYGVTSHAEVIPTGLEPESFVPGDKAAFRKRYNIPLDQPMMLFVGRVAHEKNIGFLLDVVEQVRKTLPNALLVIAGEGPARNGLEKEVATRHLSGNVTFLGYLDRRTELNHCYASADVFVFASRTETQGLVLLEAMAQSVPVVALAEMGTKDVLREGEGVRIAQNNSIDFASKVASLLTDEHARQELGAKGKQYAHTWSANSLALRLAVFYESTISQYDRR